MISRIKHSKKTIKIMTLLIVVIVCSALFISCSKASNKYDKEVEKAITAIKKEWLKDKRSGEFKPYLEVKNTRIIFLKDNVSGDFNNYDYVIEFILFSNYFGSAPYYDDSGIKDSVVVYKDGHTEVKDKNPFKEYRSKTFESDLSGVMENITDLGSKYNQVLELEK